MDIAVYIHGKNGSKDEANHYKELLPSFEVIGIEYGSTVPWAAGKEITEAIASLSVGCNRIIIIANSPEVLKNPKK